MRYNQGSGTNAFTMFTDNTARIDSILGFGTAETYIDNVLAREFVSPQIRAARNLSPDWERIRQSIAVVYPKLADEVAQRTQVQYYQQHNDWHRFQKAVVLYMLTYGAHASANELNQYARAVFDNCKDMTCVSEALEWSKRSLQEGPNARFMDTYANILYKMGKTQDAIAWEEKAADFARGRFKTDFEAVLDKMKKGENIKN
jgi:tetratricopeptide (TPR) repeat protein